MFSCTGQVTSSADNGVSTKSMCSDFLVILLAFSCLGTELRDDCLVLYNCLTLHILIQYPGGNSKGNTFTDSAELGKLENYKICGEL